MVPMDEPRLVNMTTRRIRVTLFRQNPFMETISSGIDSRSFTFGFLAKASTRPDTQPAAIIGFKEVSGAASTDERMVKGWARARVAPMPAKIPLAAIQIQIIGYGDSSTGGLERMGLLSRNVLELSGG